MWYNGGWPENVPVAKRRANAEKLVRTLRKQGEALAPVVIEGNKIAASFWGKAWCDNLEGYRDYENRLGRGRSYVRNGQVVDLRIAPGVVTALVSGSDLYRVQVRVAAVPAARWRAVCQDCAGSIDSLVELLQGKLSRKVMERICRQESGLFPLSKEIKFSCSCPDYASMCKHVAAVLYGVGARLDAQPELLFELRAVAAAELLAGLETRALVGKGADRALASEDISALFGIEMAESVPVVPAGAKTATKPRPIEKPQPAARRKPIAAQPQPVVTKKSPARPKPAKPPLVIMPDGAVKWWT